MKLGIVPEGPLAFDGERYLYSEGEGVYLDALADRFDEIVVCAYAYERGQAGYESVALRPFRSTNMRVVRLPWASGESPGMASKFIQMARVAAILRRELPGWDACYLFIPGYPSAIAYLLNIFYRKPYFVYAASDWSREESGLIFRWDGWRRRLFLPLVAWASEVCEIAMIRGARFVLTAGRQAAGRYHPLASRVEETVPRLNWPALALDPGGERFANETISLLFVGTLYERKGIRFLLRAIEMLGEVDGRPIRLLLAGDGPQRREYERWVGERGLERRVEFLGHVPNGPQLYARYRECDAFVFPSLGEGFPRVLYEAMAHGLPIVATAVSGVPALMCDGINALLVPPGEAGSLAAAVTRLAREPDLRRTMAAANRRLIEELLANSDGGAQVERLWRQTSVAGLSRGRSASDAARENPIE